MSLSIDSSSGGGLSPAKRCGSRWFRLWAAGMLVLELLRAGPAPDAGSPDLGTNAPVTLADAVRVATLRNWDLLATQAEVDRATAEQIIAQQFPNPTLSVSVTKAPINSQSGATILGNGYFERSYDQIAAVNQLFEIGGKRSARKAAAKAGAEAARARFIDARRQLQLGVTRAYVAAVLAAENARILRASSDSLRREAGVAETRLTAGDISKADRDQIQISADRFELDAVQAEAAAQGARIQLELLLGVRDPRGGIVLSSTVESLAGTAPPPESSRPTLDRPDVEAARLAVRQAEENIRLQKALRVPDPTVLAQYEREPPDQTSTVGFGVSLPLPLWNRNRGGISAAEADYRQAETNARRTEAEALAEIARARREFEAARLRADRYSSQIVPQSAEVARSVRFAYGRGGASLVDLLTAERNDNEVRLAAAVAAADLANARAALHAALNLPPDHVPSS